MALRPQAFSIPSSTELKVTFNSKLSEKLTIDNFEVESLNGAVSNLEILSISIDDSIVKIKTRPQVSGNYYLLKFLDTGFQVFNSSTGSRLIDDSVSRELFFIGIDNVNPIRDRMLERVPGLFNLENSNIKNILSAHAEELYTSQKKVGELLSDNYISIDVEDEFRVRGSGATDRFANEQAYELTRVSKRPTGAFPIRDILDYTSNNDFERLESFPTYPISLRQVIVADEEISKDTSGNNFDGYLITVSNNNIIKLLSLKIIKDGETVDCDGEIGTEYNIERFKYTISNNYYDQDGAFKYSKLNNNQILISQFGNIDKPAPGDKIIISYLYKDNSRSILNDEILVSRVEIRNNESVPSNTKRFFLGRAPIVTSENKVPTKDGVRFFLNENSDESPDEFKRELPFNISKLPSKPGEYTVNYETGEVFLIGGEDRKGTSRNNYVADYLYRKEFLRDLDYSISGSDLVANPDRNLSNNEAEILIKYESSFAEDVDYSFKSHIEVMGEQVENRISQAFSVSAKNSPITNIYRVYNQTTGEVYNPLYSINSEIYFSGNRSPEVRLQDGELSSFRKVINEEIEIIGEFIIPVFEVQITSNISNNSILFSPGIPAEFIDVNSSDYFFRETSDSEEIMVDDINIRFFGDEDGNNLISSAGISSTANPPANGSKVIIGTRGYIIALEKNGVLNQNLDSIGFYGNTSISFSNNNLFKCEKFFESFDTTKGFIETSNSDTLSIQFGSEETLYANLSRLRKTGDYSVDYDRGIIYVAVSAEKDLSMGNVDYSVNEHVSRYSNILSSSGAFKKISSANDITQSSIIYSNISNDVESIKLKDLESSIVYFDDITEAVDEDNNLQLICEVLENYTAVVPYNIQFLNGVYEYSSLVGKNLNATAEIDRTLDANAKDLVLPKSQGGYKLNDGISISFDKNIIDLKKKTNRRVYQQGDNLIVSILDDSAKSFYECNIASSGESFFNSKLNITKISNIRIVDSYLSGGNAVVSIITDNLSEIDTDGDYLLDSNENRFRILSVDTLTSVLTLESPAENNPLADLPELDPEGLNSEIIVKPSVTISDGTIFIEVPIDSGISAGTLLEFVYLTNNTPEIGTPLAVDYRFGNIYFDYSYVYDQIAIWYEYGDNEIDWSISSSLEEGDEYYISYKYGANREALRTNFGALTNVSFFENFPLEVDRELYRNGVKGTIQAFPKGPTIPAFEGMISSFTDINPDIEELSFASWILGRDFADPTTVFSEGNLTFTDGKFDSGLLFDNQTAVYVPSVSNISLQEGTLEAWIRPEWSGISNDATLTFNLYGIGQEISLLPANKDPFDFEYNWIISPVDEIGGIIDTNGLGNRISNYKIVDGDDEYESFYNGIYKSFKNLNRLTNIESEARIKILNYGSHFNRISVKNPITLTESNSVGKYFINDSYKSCGFDFKLDPVFDEFGAITFVTVDSDLTLEEIPNYIRPHRTRSCSCSINNNISILKNFNSMTIEIDLGFEINLSMLKNECDITKADPRAFSIIDDNGDIYEVVGFIDSLGVTYEEKIPDSFSKIIVNRFPENNQSIKQKSLDEINSLVPAGFLTLFCKKIEIMGVGKDNALIAFNNKSSFVLNWSNYYSYKINRQPQNNIVTYSINNNNYNGFYTDCYSIEDLEISFSINEFDNRGIYLGPLNKDILSNMDIYDSKTIFYNRFNFSDIYIGKNGYSPRKNNFSINKDDSPNTSIGLPGNVFDDEGIFIGFDDTCTSPLSEDTGQWVFRTRAGRVKTLPVDVIVNGLNNYENINESVSIDHVFSGFILTDGEFSSVVRSTRDELDGGCTDGIICDKSFRYCGNELLEDYGWSKIEETDSDVINTIVGGRETLHGLWRKEGTFDTLSSSGIYRAGPSKSEGLDLENLIFTSLPCSGGNTEYIISSKVVSYDSNILGSEIGRFSGSTSGNLIGVTPINIDDFNFNFKLSLAINDIDEGIICIIDGNNNEFVDIIKYNWNDFNFHEYKVEINYDDQEVIIYIDNFIISKVLFSDFEDNPDIINQSIKLHVFDGEIINSEDFHENLSGNIIDVDLIFFSGFYQEGDGYLESSDVLINTDDRIDFEFNIDNLDGYYIDGYDGYDSYLIEQDIIGVDEMFILSDKLRYIVDTGIDNSQERLSIFKDGKGFLNFRIFDNSLRKNKEVGMFNIATNIKHFRAGEIHHVAASWKLNSINEKDEMHLFLDGQEVPNLYRFGGKVPVRLNEKYSDISKEILQSFLVRDIIYPELFTDGNVVALGSLFSSPSITFTEDMIGRSIIVKNAPIANNLIGMELIIKGVTNGSAILGTGESLNTVEFIASDSNIEFSFAPYTSNILTDLRNSRFFIFKKDSLGNVTEMGGILYQVSNGEIDIISGQNVFEPQYRVNVETRLIEFIGRDSDCKYLETVSEDDVEIHIRTFGLSLELCKEKINLSGSSYEVGDIKFSGQSVLNLHAKEPVSLEDVKIKRIVLDRTVVDIVSPILNPDGTYTATFSIDLDPEISKVSSSEGSIFRQNLGRYLSLIIDSDNIDFCQFDGYEDGYQDGTLDGLINTVTIYGETVDGINEETFFIDKNGNIDGEKLFTRVDRVEGNINIIDPNYFELGVISIEERDDLSISNNNGERLEVFEYQSGHFILTTVGSNGTFPYELHAGYYNIEYPTYLIIKVREAGQNIYIGTDFNKENHFGGSIDEFRVISEISSDTRKTEENTAGSRSVTNDYLAPDEFCPDEQTLCLIHFNDPIQLQERRLRNKRFLNEDSNFKYGLERKQRESLLLSINNEEEFVKKMINFNFDIDDSIKTYTESHYADGGPIWNEAGFYKNYADYILANKSVNDNFGNSAYFVPNKNFIFENDKGYFRKDEGTIEFWVSPVLDTKVDEERRYYLDISSARRIKVKAKSPRVIELPNPASEVINIKLITKKTRDKNLYNDKDRILFDEIERSEISGVLEGGTGSQKDFSVGHKLSADGKKVYLAESLPGSALEVVICYIPLGSQGDRLSVFKNEYSQIVFGITAGGIDNVISADINWKKNTWHRIKLTYKTNSNGSDYIRMIVDGKNCGIIKYGTGLIYGTGYIYGQYLCDEDVSNRIKYKIPLLDNLKIISIGSDVFGDFSAYSRIDNFRFSRIARRDGIDSDGLPIDSNYSENTNTVYPVIEDDATTLLINFDESGDKIDKFIRIIDPKNGIFNFKIDVIDNFDKVIGINDGLIEDLIVELVNTLKPAHSNAYVKFIKSKC